CNPRLTRRSRNDQTLARSKANASGNASVQHQRCGARSPRTSCTQSCTDPMSISSDPVACTAEGTRYLSLSSPEESPLLLRDDVLRESFPRGRTSLKTRSLGPRVLSTIRFSTQDKRRTSPCLRSQRHWPPWHRQDLSSSFPHNGRHRQAWSKLRRWQQLSP